MFSANENIALRQHKRRIIQCVEETIPEDLLDEGTTVLCMQVSCKAPGCVPLETVVTIVFPTVAAILPNLSGCKGTTYQTKILLPMAQVTKDDVLEALPPAFEGGRQSVERLGLRARDVMIAQVEQIFVDKESKKAMAEYLQQCLQDYLERDCVAPEYGEPYAEKEKKNGGITSDVEAIQKSTGNIVIRRPVDNEDDKKKEPEAAPKPPVASSRAPAFATANDWRRQQNVERQVASAVIGNSSAQLLQRLEHAPGVRQSGCPCCDPDNPSNYVDSMMML